MLQLVTIVTLACLLAACTAPAPSVEPTSSSALAAPTSTTLPPPLVATRDPNFTPPPRPIFYAPTASASERQNASSTWLYLTAFQSGYISVIDPHSGHVLREFAVTGDQAGMAVSPDGTRLYILDGWGDGELRIYNTRNWEIVHRRPISDRALLLGGNPIALSGDGRWLRVARLNASTRQGWSSTFDTQRLTFLPEDALPVQNCHEAWLPIELIGRVGHPRLYAHCRGFIMALDAQTLTKQWEVTAPTATKPALILAPDGARLYGLYPRVGDLRLQIWETAKGELVKEMLLGDRLSIPTQTFGRG
ncbi:MAG: hypothetical protein LC737_09865, partial [Chloroflexi bacterium]|nr:hypothetical protein [Chloroflexota bacterium]